MIKIILMLILLFCFLGCGNDDNQDTLIFSVMGDVPRSAWEDTLLQTQIADHNEKSPSEFMLHVGDIKTGSSPCDELVYARVAGYLKALKIPVFIVPGDNEWNDCPDPDSAWSYWQMYFADFEKNWSYKVNVEHQDRHRENMAWVSKNVLLIGINLVGGRVHDQNAWQEMMQAANTWITLQFQAHNNRVFAAVVFAQAKPNEKHQWFMERYIAQVQSFAKPVLYLHGDGHRWLYDKKWHAENLTRIQVDQGKLAVPLEIRVDAQSDSTFSFNRKPFPMPE